jgi:hypothetical protein
MKQKSNSTVLSPTTHILADPNKVVMSEQNRHAVQRDAHGLRARIKSW